MNRQNRIRLLKLVICFSLVIIFSGIAFDLNSKNRLINTSMDNYILSPSSVNGTISITKVDKLDKQKLKKVDNNTNNINSEVDSENSKLRKSIKDKYDITVKYGLETDGYEVSNMKGISLIDSNEINKSLEELVLNLSYYPSGLFKEMNDEGYNLNIYLLQKYDIDDVTGITDSSSKNVIISIATEYQFKESVHHELYHYIEKYIYLKGGKYPTWSNLNPAGFNYGKADSMLSYNYTNSSDAYFVNNYAQTAEDEDRASTFEYMMMDNKSSCFETRKPIWLKAKYICDQIQIVFDSVKEDKQEYWERFVY